MHWVGRVGLGKIVLVVLVDRNIGAAQVDAMRLRVVAVDGCVSWFCFGDMIWHIAQVHVRGPG